MGDEVAFVEQPQDSLFVSGKSTSSAPANVKCLVKNSIKTIMECNNQIRDDVKRTVYWVNLKLEFNLVRNVVVSKHKEPNIQRIKTLKPLKRHCLTFEWTIFIRIYCNGSMRPV